MGGSRRRLGRQCRLRFHSSSPSTLSAQQSRRHHRRHRSHWARRGRFPVSVPGGRMKSKNGAAWPSAWLTAHRGQRETNSSLHHASHCSCSAARSAASVATAAASAASALRLRRRARSPSARFGHFRGRPGPRLRSVIVARAPDRPAAPEAAPNSLGKILPRPRGGQGSPRCAPQAHRHERATPHRRRRAYQHRNSPPDRREAPTGGRPPPRGSNPPSPAGVP